jgi:hypothetical protein
MKASKTAGRSGRGAPVRRKHPVAALGEVAGDGGADPARPARDQDGQVVLHDDPSIDQRCAESAGPKAATTDARDTGPPCPR